MAKLWKLMVISTFLIHYRISANCRFADPKSPEMAAIRKSQADFLLGRSLEAAIGAAKSSDTIDPRVSNICSVPLRPTAINKDTHARSFLGQGAFGTVWAVNFKDENESKDKAVKIVTFKDYAQKSLADKFVKNASKDKIIATTMDRLDKIDLLDPPFELDANVMSGFNIPQEKLASALKQAYEEAGLTDASTFVSGLLVAYWDLLIQEVSLNELIRDALTGSQHAAAQYDQCLIDANLNLYVIMQRLGPTLYDVRASCLTPLNGRGLSDKIPRNERLLSTVARLNEKGISVCDIKLENTLFDLDYNPQEVFIADFGLSTQMTPCKGGTPAYTPPEARFATFKQSTFHTLTARGTRLMTLFDSYSLGMVIAALELDVPSFMLIYRAFQTTIDSLNEIHDYAIYLKYIRQLQELVKDELEALETAITDPDPQRQSYQRKLQGVTNRIILGLMDPDYETRLSTQEASHLFSLLSKYVNDEALALSAGPKLEALLKKLDEIDSLLNRTKELSPETISMSEPPVDSRSRAEVPIDQYLAASLPLPANIESISTDQKGGLIGAKRLLI